MEGTEAPDLAALPPSRIRNFGIIAHIDHGKSTLADRLLQLTGCLTHPTTTPSLDSLPVERSRGITVKAQTASIFHSGHLLNLIDTPGHADFSQEVGRTVGVIEGVVLVVDAVEGVQAQTVAHYGRAREGGAKAVVPVINKIDLPQANVDAVLEQLEGQLGLDIFNMPVLTVSAKSGLNVQQVLPAIIERIPPPCEDAALEEPLEVSLIDSWHREFRGVICLVGVRKGRLLPGTTIRSVARGSTFVIDEIGLLQPPDLIRTDYLGAGQVGYIRCGMKSPQDAVIGDTFLLPSITLPDPTRYPIPPRMTPVVFAGMFPALREEHDQVMLAMDRLLLNDSSVTSEKVTSVALGPGWRLGFLGSLHMDVFAQRLEQEFHVKVILTTPNVSYEAILKDGTSRMIDSPESYPDPASVKEFREPLVKATLILPTSTIGAISKLCAEARCGETNLEYLSMERAKMVTTLPMAEVIGDFNDRLLSISAGYASFDYEAAGRRPVELVKVGVRLNGDLVDILSTVQPRCKAEAVGRQWVTRLASLLPPQQFPIAIQAIIGTRIIARDTISALRKDVIAKCVPPSSSLINNP